MLHNVQTRDEFPCIILAWTINDLTLQRILEKTWRFKPNVLHQRNKHRSERLLQILRSTWVCWGKMRRSLQTKGRSVQLLKVTGGGEKAKLRAVFFKKFLCGQVVGWLQILLDTISHDRIYFLFLCQAHCIGVFIRITCMRYNNMFTHSFILHFRGEFFLFFKSCIQILDCPLQFDLFDVHLWMQYNHSLYHCACVFVRMWVYICVHMWWQTFLFLFLLCLYGLYYAK